MDVEGLSTQELEIFYGQSKRNPDFDVKYDYCRYIPTLTPAEDYFSPKKN